MVNETLMMLNGKPLEKDCILLPAICKAHD